MKAGQVKVLLGPCDEPLQVRLVDGTNGILASGYQLSPSCCLGQAGLTYDIRAL